VKHFAAPEFWSHYNSLPEEVRRLADKNFLLLKANASHPSLRLKKIGINWSVRTGIHYRALGKDREEGIIWTWIGPHSEYDRLLAT
jgi:hypothetical protein